jgi:hypothetical protein
MGNKSNNTKKMFFSILFYFSFLDSPHQFNIPLHQETEKKKWKNRKRIRKKKKW